MAKIIPLEYLETVVEHSISNMKRIKKELALAEVIESVHFISLAILNINLNTKEYADDFTKTIGGVLRDSDIICAKNGFIYLFLPGTNFEGVMDIMNDFKEFYDGIFDYVVAAYLLSDIKNTARILPDLRKLASDKGWKV
ncbi:MAG TPA: hypothetical protein ENI54_04165 [bacterium]|nr:hypothetical protein [bacterium]